MKIKELIQKLENRAIQKLFSYISVLFVFHEFGYIVRIFSSLFFVFFSKFNSPFFYVVSWFHFFYNLFLCFFVSFFRVFLWVSWPRLLSCFFVTLFRVISWFSWLFFLCFLVGLATADVNEKNGVSPNSISLPSGPGSVEGLGSSYEPLLSQGMFRYSVPIVLPKLGGLEPQLSLVYDTAKGNSTISRGWHLPLSFIQRQTSKRIPRYIDSNNQKDDDYDGVIDNPEELDSFVGINQSELIQLTNGTYQARIESDFIKYEKKQHFFEATLKNGTKLIFGKSSQAQITNEDGSKIFKWLLEKKTDVFGNEVHYTYTSFKNSPNQKYIQTIHYAKGAAPWDAYYEISFEYIDAPLFTKDYLSGFLIQTSKRLTQINVNIYSQNVSSPLIRRYKLEYQSNEPYFLEKITNFASDGISYLPPLHFKYAGKTPATLIHASRFVQRSINIPRLLIDSKNVAFLDVNQDGLPDLFESKPYGDIAQVVLNLGEKDEMIHWSKPQEIRSKDSLSRNLSLDKESVYLADMDGDGLADLVNNVSIREAYYFKNQGNVSFSKKQPMSLIGRGPPSPYSSKSVLHTDLDFDKRIDIVQSSTGGYQVWFNHKVGEYSKKVLTQGVRHQGNILDFREQGVLLADINGDRLQDIIQVKASSIWYAANKGYGNFAELIQLNIPDLEIPYFDVSKVRTIDLNSDGLSDFVLETPDHRSLWIWRNIGGDSFSKKHVISGLPPRFGKNATSTWVDINGNGSKDWVLADSQAQRLVYLDVRDLWMQSQSPYLLDSIDSGLGILRNIHYKSSTKDYLKAKEVGNPWQKTLPFPVNVIQTTTLENWADVDAIKGVDQKITHYTYINGYYDFIQKSFAGFEQIQVIEQDASSSSALLKTEYYFHTGAPDSLDNDGDQSIDEIIYKEDTEEIPLKGKLLKMIRMNEQDQIFDEEINTWKIKTLQQDTFLKREQVLVFLRDKKKKIFEKTDKPHTIQEQFEVDEFGNVTKHTELGSDLILGDERIKQFEFINDTKAWILGLPQEERLESINGDKIAQSFYYYDGADYQGLDLGKVTLGQLKRKSAWVQEESSTDIFINTESYKHDSYGNITAIQDGNDHIRTLEYEDEFHHFITKEIIPTQSGKQDLELEVKVEFKFGNITQSIGFNGEITQYHYDHFGRFVQMISPLDSKKFPTISYQYYLSDPFRKILYTYDATGDVSIKTDITQLSSIHIQKREVSGELGVLEHFEYFDGLGQKLASVQENNTGWIVSNAQFFNVFGKPIFSFLPFETNQKEYQKPTLDLQKVAIQYDAMQREILTSQMAEKGTPSISSVKYFPLSKEMTNPNGINKVSFQDGLGRLIEIQEQNQGETYVTQYQYTLLDHLKQVIDAQNNIKKMGYDGLGRKTWMKDPDQGITEYQYDAINLIQKKDAKGQIIEYEYDKASRVLAEYWTERGNKEKKIQYVYDTSNNNYLNATHLKGRLSYIKDQSGGEFYSYDKLGNVDEKIKRIVLNQEKVFEDALRCLLWEDQKDVLSKLFLKNDCIDFKFSYDHDAIGRITAMQFPDAEEITYQYNQRGLLEKIPNFLKFMEYKANGSIAYLHLHNGVQSDYEYNIRGFLENLKHTNANSSTVFSHLEYEYDLVGNITGIQDHHQSLNSLKNNTQVFLYDDLNRLTQVSSDSFGIIDYGYDKIGNVTYKSSPKGQLGFIGDDLINLGTLSYGGSLGSENREGRTKGDSPGPHAMTSSTSGLSYDYDVVGNLISKTTKDPKESLILKWDFQNRLIETEKNQKKTSYVYDGSGRRVIKKSSFLNQQDTSDDALITDASDDSLTLYVSKDYEIRKDVVHKMIFAGSKRIARITEGLGVDQNDASDVNIQSFEFVKGWNFFTLKVILENASIEEVLKPIEDLIKQVVQYDSNSKKYIRYVPSESIHEIKELKPKEGYVIELKEGTRFEIQGREVQVEDITLQKGWNLAGFPIVQKEGVVQVTKSLQDQEFVVWGQGSSHKGISSKDASDRDSSEEGGQYFYSDSLLGDHPKFINQLFYLAADQSYWVWVAENTVVEALHLSERRVSYYHSDHLGSNSFLTNESGSILEETYFYPFGRPRFKEVHTIYDAKYTFTDKEQDQETDLYYFEARYMDPVVGKFITPDPYFVNPNQLSKEHYQRYITNPQEHNLYSYTLNNPINYTDPTGEVVCGGVCVGAIAVGIVSGALLKSCYDAEKNNRKIIKMMNKMKLNAEFEQDISFDKDSNQTFKYIEDTLNNAKYIKVGLTGLQVINSIVFPSSTRKVAERLSELYDIANSGGMNPFSPDLRDIIEASVHIDNISKQRILDAIKIRWSLCDDNSELGRFWKELGQTFEALFNGKLKSEFELED